MHKEVTNKQIQQILREKTYETINVFDPVESDVSELVKLHHVVQRVQGGDEITSKQLVLALREKTYEAVTAFDPTENDAEELVHLQYVMEQLSNLPTYAESNTETPAS